MGFVYLHKYRSEFELKWGCKSAVRLREIGLQVFLSVEATFTFNPTYQESCQLYLPKNWLVFLGWTIFAGQWCKIRQPKFLATLPANQILLPRKVWMPHSLLSKPVQRLARSFSPSAVGRVQGWQPMER